MFKKLKSKKVVGAIVGALTLVLASATGFGWLSHDIVDAGLTEITCVLLECTTGE